VCLGVKKILFGPMILSECYVAWISFNKKIMNDSR